MKKYVQIVNKKAYWIFEAEELPPYPNPEGFLDITGREGIEEGFLYNSETGEFTAPQPQTISEPITPIEQVAEETLLETKYQTFLLEMMM